MSSLCSEEMKSSCIANKSVLSVKKLTLSSWNKGARLSVVHENNISREEKKTEKKKILMIVKYTYPKNEFNLELS